MLVPNLFAVWNKAQTVDPSSMELKGMKIFCAALVVLTVAQAEAKTSVVYGTDNRKDLYQVTNPLYLKLAKSTAGMIPLSKLIKASDTSFDLQTRSLERSQNVCPSEAFSQQMTAASCSGFLVGPDTLVTAGHCFKSFSTPENVCKTFAWVFDYDMKSEAHEPQKNISAKNVYNCKEIVHAVLDSARDFAIIKLDRKVEGRPALKVRTSGKIESSASLVVIGHPSGLPTKISDAGKVTNNIHPTRFSTNLDTFHGNSGSAVFNAKTGMIEGILIQGKNDYRLSRPEDDSSCMVVNVCDENGNNCAAGEETGAVAFGEVVQRVDSFQRELAEALKQ